MVSNEIMFVIRDFKWLKMEFRKKGFENDFFKVVAYILLSIEIFKGYFGRVIEDCEET